MFGTGPDRHRYALFDEQRDREFWDHYDHWRYRLYRTQTRMLIWSIVFRLCRRLWLWIIIALFLAACAGLVMMQRDYDASHGVSSVTLMASTTPHSEFWDTIDNTQKFNAWQANFLTWLRPRVLFLAPFVFGLGMAIRRLSPRHNKAKGWGYLLTVGPAVIVVIVLFGHQAWELVQGPVWSFVQSHVLS